VSWVPVLAVGSTAAFVGAVLCLRDREPTEVALAAAFSSVVVALAYVDLRRGVIPNRLIYPSLVLAIAVSGAWPDRGSVASLIGGIGALALFAIIRAFSHGLGGGDVKMAALAGAVVGYPDVLLALLTTASAGGATAAVIVTARKVEGRSALPYGPFLALGVLTGVVL